MRERERERERTLETGCGARAVHSIIGQGQGQALVLVRRTGTGETRWKAPSGCRWSNRSMQATRARALTAPFSERTLQPAVGSAREPDLDCVVARSSCASVASPPVRARLSSF